jgi:hypothetical protein
MMKNLLQSAARWTKSSPSDARPSRRFQAFAEDDDDDDEFAMAHSLESSYVAPTSLRDNHIAKVLQKKSGDDDVVDEEDPASSSSRPKDNNPFAM